jgi:uncharacterized protein involved in exopolysaccharide biosynthesis
MTNELQTIPPAPQAGRQLDVKTILAMLIRRRWIVLGVALPIILVALITILRSSESVSASSRVLVETGMPETLQMTRVIFDYDVFMSNATQVALSLPVAVKAADALIDSVPRLAASYPEFADIKTHENLRDLLINGIDAHQVGESTIMKIAYKHTRPEFALMAVGALTDAFIEFNTETQQNPRAVGFYNDQIAAVEAEIDSLIQQKVVILGESGQAMFDGQNGARAYQILGLEEEYVRVHSRRVGVETRLNGLREMVADDPDYVPTGLSGGDLVLAELRRKLDQLNAELAKLLVQYQEDSEWVRRQKQLIVRARAELHAERDDRLRELALELEELKTTENSLKSVVDEQARRLASFPSIQQRIQALELQIDAKRKLMQGLQIKRGEARVKAMADFRISNITVLDEPTLDSWVAGGKKFLYLALASTFALALGFIAAMFVENQDQRFLDQRQTEKYLELPVLGSISSPKTKDRAS